MTIWLVHLVLDLLAVDDLVAPDFLTQVEVHDRVQVILELLLRELLGLEGLAVGPAGRLVFGESPASRRVEVVLEALPQNAQVVPVQEVLYFAEEFAQFALPVVEGLDFAW